MPRIVVCKVCRDAHWEDRPCPTCDGTGEAAEARPISLRDALDDAADDFEAQMHMLLKRGADFSVVIGDAVDAMRKEVIRMDAVSTDHKREQG